jgi:Outer membrane protein beta-barrel domain
MKKLQFVCYLLLLFVVCSSAQAQFKRNRGTRRTFSDNIYGIWKITAGGGIASYKGDLGGPPNASIRPIRFSLYAGAQYRLTGKWSLKGEFGYYQIEGDDAKGKNPQRNLSFRSSSFEGYIAGMWDFVRFTRQYSRQTVNPFRPYLFAGLGFTTVNPRAQYSDGTWYPLRNYQTEGKKYSSVALTVPLGIGFSYPISRTFDISLEGSYRFTSTDYLDDVSKSYIAPTGDPVRDYFSSREATRPEAGGKRGDPGKKDGYFVVTVKLEFSTVPTQNRGGYSRRQPKYRRNNR